MLVVSSLSSMPDPDLRAGSASDPAQERTLPLWPELQETLSDGLWRTVQERFRRRKGLPPTEWGERAGHLAWRVPAHDAFSGGDLGRRLRVALDWTLTLAETPTGVISGEGRHRELMRALGRIAWLMDALIRQYGEARAWLVLDDAFDALLVGAAGG